MVWGNILYAGLNLVKILGAEGIKEVAPFTVCDFQKGENVRRHGELTAP